MDEHRHELGFVYRNDDGRQYGKTDGSLYERLSQIAKEQPAGCSFYWDAVQKRQLSDSQYLPNLL